MRCKECKGPVVAVDLMPRVIALRGEPGKDDEGYNNWDFDPDSRDEDIYDCSITVGFGCDTPDCGNRWTNVGEVHFEDGVPWVSAATNNLADVAEEGEPQR